MCVCAQCRLWPSLVKHAYPAYMIVLWLSKNRQQATAVSRSINVSNERKTEILLKERKLLTGIIRLLNI